MALKKDTDVSCGALVIPATKKSIFLTPQNVEHVEDFEKWIEWPAHQLGIILGVLDNTPGLIVATPNGIGICFPDEVIKI